MSKNVSIVSACFMFLFIILAVVLTVIWGTENRHNSRSIQTVCKADGYYILKYDNDIYQGYLFVIPDIQYNSNSMNRIISKTMVLKGQYATDADFSNTLAALYPKGITLTCWWSTYKKDEIWLSQFNNQPMFIAAMVMWGLAGLCLIILITNVICSCK